MAKEHSSAELREISLDVIERPATEMRTRGSEEGLEELRKSIAERGVLVPVIVVRSEKGFRLVAGKRRVLCARSVGMATVPAVIVEDDEQWELWATYAENALREKVNCVDEAQWLKWQIERQGFTGESIAGVLGVSASYVSQRLSLLEWPEDLLKPLSLGRISFSYLLAFLLLPEDASVLKRRTGLRKLPITAFHFLHDFSPHRALSDFPHSRSAIAPTPSNITRVHQAKIRRTFPSDSPFLSSSSS